MEGVAHGLAGAGGSIAAVTIVYPLEKISKEMQTRGEGGGDLATTIKRIMAENGWKGLYQGIESSLLAMAASMYSYFWSHDTIKKAILGMTGSEELNAVGDLAAGYLAGLVTAILTEPIWMINTRLMLQKRAKAKAEDSEKKDQYNGVYDCAQKVYSKEGLKGFWKGLPGAIGTVMNSAIQLAIYEQLRKLLLRRSDAPIGAGSAFLLGALSKMVATFATYPLTTVGTRMQNAGKDAGKPGAPQYSGTADCARQMLLKEGIGGFYTGLRPRLLQMVLQNAFKFMFYERIVKALLLIMLGHDA